VLSFDAVQCFPYLLFLGGGALYRIPMCSLLLNAKPLILCVDDNAPQLRLRKAVLEEDGFNILCATNVADAIAIFREAPVCCTIADHMLQGQSGIELAKELKRIKHDVPIILYSGAMPTNLQNIDVYINKGESTSDFVRIVREVVRRFCS
jgi:CheY-like chemotaxis protein